MVPIWPSLQRINFTFWKMCKKQNDTNNNKNNTKQTNKKTCQRPPKLKLFTIWPFKEQVYQVPWSSILDKNVDNSNSPLTYWIWFVVHGWECGDMGRCWAPASLRLPKKILLCLLNLRTTNFGCPQILMNVFGLADLTNELISILYCCIHNSNTVDLWCQSQET